MRARSAWSVASFTPEAFTAGSLDPQSWVVSARLLADIDEKDAGLQIVKGNSSSSTVKASRLGRGGVLGNLESFSSPSVSR
jgi:hypothetical protein